MREVKYMWLSLAGSLPKYIQRQTCLHQRCLQLRTSSWYIAAVAATTDLSKATVHEGRFHLWIYYNAWSKQIQFLEFMGGSKLPQASPNHRFVSVLLEYVWQIILTLTHNCFSHISSRSHPFPPLLQICLCPCSTVLQHRDETQPDWTISFYEGSYIPSWIYGQTGQCWFRRCLWNAVQCMYDASIGIPSHIPHVLELWLCTIRSLPGSV